MALKKTFNHLLPFEKVLNIVKMTNSIKSSYTKWCDLLIFFFYLECPRMFSESSRSLQTRQPNCVTYLFWVKNA
jgi:hypothetical protein